VVLRGQDTVAVESCVRNGVILDGDLTIYVDGGIRQTYHAVIAPDETAPLVEAAIYPPGQPEAPPERRARVIFRDDSAAVDALTRTGMDTRIFPTQAGALPYLNLSFGLLEQALRRARTLGQGEGEVGVPFFNLGGGQTVVAEVTRFGADSASIRLGTIEFDLRTDAAGRLVSAAIPAQRVVVVRR